MIATILISASLVCALIPAAMFVMNLWFYCAPVDVASTALGRHVDVLIPARDEAENIEGVLKSVLASESVAVNVWVCDDNSTDGTAAVVEAMAAEDGRIHLLRGGALPQGWNGKQHACWQLALASTAPLLLFLDADVRLEAGAIARCVAEQQQSGVALLSGFPRIVMVTWMERLLLPLIQFVLLGLLPIFRMRQTIEPAYAAGCGQFMLVERNAYFASGGHAAIRATRHDGLKLPHLFREHGLRTDLCDLTILLHVRMYSSAAGVWNGLAKNATEGLASPGRIVPITILLLLGQVLPTALLVVAVIQVIGLLPMILLHRAFVVGVERPLLLLAFLAAVFLSYLPRCIASKKFMQPLAAVALHPLGVLTLVVLQWYALLRQMIGKPVGWRARNYASSTGEEIR